MSPSKRNPRGFALIEAVLSVLIVSLLLVAALNVLGGSRAGQAWNSNRLRAHYLASDLMAEILDKPYADPGATPIFGPEPAEIIAGRTTYDDVDDYSGYTESPPKDRTGAVIPGLTGWRRDVAVAYVTPANVTVTSLTDQGVKRITVTVSRNGGTFAKLVALRTSASAR
jgi:MSHA pilin protein MshD